MADYQPKKFAVKVRFAFYMAPFGSSTLSEACQSTHKYQAINLLVDSLNSGSSIFKQFPPVVKLGGEKNPGGINILVV